MNRSSLIGSAALLAGMLTACSSASTPASTPATTDSSASSSAASIPSSTTGPANSVPATAPMITIKNFAFTTVGQVHSGGKIVVHNEDSEAHTVTADSGNAFNVMVPASSTVTLTAPAKAGSYKFHCSYHSNMHGILTVS